MSKATILLCTFILLCCMNSANLSAQSRQMGRRTIEVEVSGTATKVLLSPNEDQVLWQGGNRRNWEIMIANKNGDNAKNLTNSPHHEVDPDWSPDGSRIFYSSTETGVPQIYSMDPDGKNVQRVTDHEYGAKKPRFSAAGHFAWQVIHPRRGKVQPTDVMVKLADSEDEKVLIEKSMLPSYSWHPEGEILVVGSVGSIQFIEVASNERKTVSFPNIDAKLHAHGARQIQWSPDGERIACRIAFVGGRMGDITIFGDHEVFLIDREGNVDVFNNLESAKESHEWIDIK